MKQFLVSIGTAAVKIVVFFFLVKYVTSAATAAYSFGYRIFSEKPVTSAPGMTYTVELSEETTPKQVAQALEDYGLIRDKDLFYVQYLLSPYRGELTAGSYELSTAMTAEEMLEVLASSYQEEQEKEKEKK